MDLQYFWNILARRKWLILTVMLTTALATYFFVDRLDPTYKADAQFSTGIVDYLGIDTKGGDNFYLQKFTVEISFGNLIELMKSPRNLRFLTYRLLINDLNKDATPFRTLDSAEDYDFNYSEEDIANLVNSLELKLDRLEVPMDEAYLDKAYRDLASAYGYDTETLLEDHITIERVNETDYIRVQFESENADLSYFAVQNFCSDFERYYTYLQQKEGTETVGYFEDETEKKKADFLALKKQLDDYKAGKGLVDLDAQRNAIVTQITELELQRQQFAAKIPALRESVRDIANRMDDLDNVSVSSTIEMKTLKSAIETKRSRLNAMEAEYSTGGYEDKKLEKSINIYRKSLDEDIKKLAKLEPQSEEDELDNRDDRLLLKKIDLDVELENAIKNVTGIDAELAKLRAKSASLVSDESYVSSLESEIYVSRIEYETLNDKYSSERINFNDQRYPVKLINYPQLPNEPEDNHQLLLSAFSGILSGTFCMVAIFFLAFLDMSLNNPHQFTKFTGIRPLTSINKIDNKNLDIKQLFSATQKDAKRENFKESLRNLRYLVEESSAKKILFTSTKPNEGKTFLIVNLAHTLTLKNKKVLIVDANFKNNSLTRMSSQEMDKALLNTRLIGEANLDDSFMTQSPNTPYNLDGVDIIGNKGTSQSPSEVFAEKDFHKFIHDLGEQYDFILIESAALNNYSDTKEMVEYADKVISVFSAESEIKQADKDSIDYLQSLGHRFMGAILNKIDLKNLN